jgi:hypothetical protein
VGDRLKKFGIGLQGRPVAVQQFVRLAVGALWKKFGERADEEFKQSSDLVRMRE